MCRTLYTQFIAKPLPKWRRSPVERRGKVLLQPSFPARASRSLGCAHPKIGQGWPRLAGEVTHHFGEAKKNPVLFPYGAEGVLAPETGTIRPHMPTNRPSCPLSDSGLEVFL